MLKQLKNPIKLILIIQGFLLGTSGLFTPKVLANPVSLSSIAPEAKLVSSCNEVVPTSNFITPTESSLEEEQPLPAPTSSCASDLEILSSQPNTLISQEFIPPPETVPDSSEVLDPLQVQTVEDSDKWRFVFQPYATIPISTYGSATVKGETVNYRLGLGELLQYLNVAASGRVEAWKGNWGFIIDGYYANLQGAGSVQRTNTRTPSPINTVDYFLTKGINSNIQEVANLLDQQVQVLQGQEELKASETLQNFEREVNDLQVTLAKDAQSLETLASDFKSFTETLAQDGRKLETLSTNIQEVQSLNVPLEVDQGFKKAIALNSAIAKNQEQLRDLQQQIQNIGTIPSLDQVQQNLQQTRAVLEEAGQKVQELQQIEDSESLRTLQSTIEQDKQLIDQQIEDINKVQNFQDNREPQQINNNIDSSLQFNQGIYDFAISYNFGDSPPAGLPKEPSGKEFPRFWFQPILGVRLNSVNLQLENTINYSISSSLVNIEGTTQNTLQAGKVWLDPLIGGKLGLQLSDPITLWFRGDVSGFGLSGDTNYSWNLFFGMDWWVRENISLQLAYRFYQLNYQTGTGSNAFGFSESFNGPFLSASFHF
ncbi:hypothetical protein H6G45_05515 [Synechocystis sp. FACHB-383]|uniref:outer membrane protein n=1 Tax=Synechocystis sp. FACHB-383 TaxID=2692864 RepID=UPI001687741A|nr:hypothetical protein [Synechocystis sp. FACHB-383]MBD2652961.1 hypothetical protein [Synechocystis sp. FACHB-383]